jgi:hypothetical protein
VTPGLATSPDGDGLVAAYGFDERRGSRVTDRSHSRSTGTIRGAKRVRGGRFGRALAYDGRRDAVEIPGSAALDLASGATLEAWVKPARRDAKWRPVIVQSRERGAAGLYTRSVKSRVACVANARRVASGRGPLRPGRWNHVALTYGGGSLRLYVNARLVSSRALDQGVLEGTRPVLIGGTRNGAASFLGRLDEVRLYDRPLGAREISRDMNTPVTR